MKITKYSLRFIYCWLSRWLRASRWFAWAIRRVTVSISEAARLLGIILWWCGYSATSLRLVAAAPRLVGDEVLTRIFIESGGFTQHYCVYQCHVCDNLCFILPRGIRRYPTWKVEWGLSVSATPGIPAPLKKAKDAKTVDKEADIRVLQTHYGGVARYRGFRFAPPSATSHSLRSGVRPFRSCCGVYSLLGGYFLAFETEDVGCVVVEVCFDDDFCW